MSIVPLAGMCPQWSAVVSTNHHSDKMSTTANSLTSTKISAERNIQIFGLFGDIQIEYSFFSIKASLMDFSSLFACFFYYIMDS